jgi:PAS domain S-box-containing protein
MDNKSRKRTVTGRVVLENHEALARIRHLMYNSHDAMVLVDSEVRYVDANEAACNMLDYTVTELVGKTPVEFIQEWDRLAFMDTYPEFLKNRLQRGEHSWVRKDGLILQLEWYGIADIAPGFHLAILSDMTGRRLTGKVFDLSDKALSKRFLANPDIITIRDCQSAKYVEVNYAFLREFNYTRDQVIGKKPSELGIWVDPEREDAEIENHTQICDIEDQLHCNQGNVRTVFRSSETISLEGKKYIISVTKDITDFMDLERELIEIADRERWRIGQDLHDNLGQHLAGIGYMVKTLHQSLTERGLPEAATLAKIIEYLQVAHGKIRYLARWIHPLDLQNDCLETALQKLAENVENLFPVTVRLESHCGTYPADPNIAANLYYITQEAISNAIKHGRARNVSVALKMESEGVTLTVKDDGSGLVKDHTKSDGLGLCNMKYRARVIGATLDIWSDPGKYTIVRCSLRKHGEDQA